MLDWYAAKPQTALRAWGRRPVSGIRTYFYLEALAFDCGGLPNDPKAIAEMAGISVEEVSECFDFFRSRCADPDAETLMPTCVTESQTKMSESRSKRSQAAQIAGQASAEAKARTKNQQLTGNDSPTIANDEPTISTNSNSNSNMTVTETKKSKSHTAPIGTAAARNEFCDLFAELYLANYQIPYSSKKADFVQLAECRKKYAVAGWVLFLERFKQGAEHYFQTPLGKHTLADLCVNFGTYYKSPLDRYGKPQIEEMERKQDDSQSNGTNYRNANAGENKPTLRANAGIKQYTAREGSI